MLVRLDFDGKEGYFRYRSSSLLSEFFQDCDTNYRHDGSTRNYWVAATLEKILEEPHLNANTPPETFSKVIQALMDQGDAVNEDSQRKKALSILSAALVREGFEAFYGPDKKCYYGTLRATPLPPRRQIPTAHSPLLNSKDASTLLLI